MAILTPNSFEHIIAHLGVTADYVRAVELGIDTPEMAAGLNESFARTVKAEEAYVHDDANIADGTTGQAVHDGIHDAMRALTGIAWWRNPKGEAVGEFPEDEDGE